MGTQYLIRRVQPHRIKYCVPRIRHIRGGLDRGKARIGIVVARFNEYLTSKLLEGAVDTLKRSGVRAGHIDVYHVPGSFEIPLVVKRALKKRRYNAMITLGVILKGETRHYKQISDNAARGTMEASLAHDIPVIHGVITAESFQQAVERVGGKPGHKGRESALSALEMADLMKRINSSKFGDTRRVGDSPRVGDTHFRRKWVSPTGRVSPARRVSP